MLTLDDIKEFRKGGFTDLEIGEINEDLRLRPQSIDPNNEAWQQVFKARLDYIRLKLSQGKTLLQVFGIINSYIMRKHKQSPWDYLREIYPIKGGKKTDFDKRVAARAKIVEHFGRAYK